MNFIYTYFYPPGTADVEFCGQEDTSGIDIWVQKCLSDDVKIYYKSDKNKWSKVAQMKESHFISNLD